MAEPSLDVDDAISFILLYLRDPQIRAPQSSMGNPGYDVFLVHVVRAFVVHDGSASNGLEVTVKRRQAEFSVFFDAAWELCRRGVLRPSVRDASYQGGPHGYSGQGFSLTTYGRAWVAAANPDLIPTQPGRYAQLFAKAGGRFGSGFLERAHEAIAAYNALAYLACCAMCGAAAESVTLALAIGRTGDEAKVLDRYRKGDGRRQVENLVLTGQSAQIHDEFRRYTDLLKYWRDSAAHGRAVNIEEAEAYSSLALLLRFARPKFPWAVVRK
jgi:hypothetical protein